MSLSLSEFDVACIRRAIKLAREAERAGNLPVGAVIGLAGEIITEGQSAIWSPQFRPHRHAEIEALCSVPDGLWERSREMTLYTTLEPCLMCMGAILLHRVGRVVYGSADDYGGAGTVSEHLPTYFRERLSETEWIGPAYPRECDPLFERLTEIEGIRDLARAGISQGVATINLSGITSTVASLQRSKQFYEEILGLEPDAFYAPTQWQSYHCQEGVYIAIGEAPGSTDEISFLVADVEALWLRVKDRAEVVNPLEKTPWGTWRFVIQDPDGHHLAFGQRQIE